MKKTAAVIFAASLLILCIFNSCKGKDGGMVSENNTANRVESRSDEYSEVSTMPATRDANPVTELASDIREFGSNAESKAQELKTDAESALSDIFDATDTANR